MNITISEIITFLTAMGGGAGLKHLLNIRSARRQETNKVEFEEFQGVGDMVKSAMMQLNDMLGKYEELQAKYTELLQKSSKESSELHLENNQLRTDLKDRKSVV